MSNLNNFEPFDPTRIKWSRYRQKLKHFLIANDVKEDKMLSTVLTLIGDLAFNVLCDLIAPECLESKEVDDALDILDRHFSPRTIARAERFKFRSRKRNTGESILDFIAALRRMSVDCDFHDQLDANLADQFIFGLGNPNLQRRLLTEEDNVSFEKLVHVASLAELTDKSSHSLNASNEVGVDICKLATNNITCGVLTQQTASKKCCHCGASNHLAKDCRFIGAKCFSCGSLGHIKPFCKKKKFKPNRFNKADRHRDVSRQVNTAEQDVDEAGVTFHLNPIKVSLGDTQPLVIDVQINNTSCRFEIDTGAAVSIMPLSSFRKYFPIINLTPTNVVLRTIAQRIIPVGKALVDVKFQHSVAEKLNLYIVKEGNISLLGREWFKPLNILQDLFSTSLLSVKKEDFSFLLDKLLDKFKDLFTAELGALVKFKAHLLVREGAVPRFFKARPVPYALLSAIETELLKLQGQGILTPIQFSDWASPIVPIVKKDKSIRICGDYKVGLNPVLLTNQYPLPKIDDLLAKLAGGKFFTKLDMTQAYQQVVMADDSTEYLTINTHKGLFAVNRLPFGISSAPAIFQQFMDMILCDLPGVVCYLDDILISGATLESHLQRIELVFQKLSDAGVRLNLKKCEFFKGSVEYLGHIVDSAGIRASPSKIKDILLAPDPKDVHQLKSFLGLVSYYRKFLPNLSSLLAPLHLLLRKDVPWSWGAEARNSFSQVKEAVTSTSVLTHFDPALPISLACDASPTGLGAVISHIFPDESEHPIAFASRSLLPAERNYSQLDKEALAIIFGVKKFHQFLYGRQFTLWTDHKPLTKILAADSQVPVLAAARLQRWSLILASYTYDIRFRSSESNLNADALSRSPCPVTEVSSSCELPGDIFLLNQVESFPIVQEDIARETLRDSTLSQVLHFMKVGWPAKEVSKVLSVFKSKSEELSFQNGCILWGLRVVIPLKLRSVLLRELHAFHTGMVKMKMIARSFFWWPGLDSEVENLVRSCEVCATHANSPAKAPLHPWSRPEFPWQRVHIDYAGPFMGYYFLVTVDAYSKWPEVNIMKSTTTMDTIIVLNEHFSHYGFPVQLVSDNGSQFTAHAFKTFCYNRGILHTRSAPYHPASNGQAERFVQILKRNLKKCDGQECLSQKVSELLFAYRTTPHSLTRKTPAELFMARELRTRLHLLRPTPVCNTSVNLSQENKLRFFLPGQEVLTKNFNLRINKKWILATVKKRIGPVTYILKFSDGSSGKRHVDQITASYLSREGVTQDELDYDFFCRKVQNPNVDRTVSPPVLSKASSPVKTSPPLARRSHPVRLRKSPRRYPD